MPPEEAPVCLSASLTEEYTSPVSIQNTFLLHFFPFSLPFSLPFLERISFGIFPTFFFLPSMVFGCRFIFSALAFPCFLLLLVVLGWEFRFSAFFFPFSLQTSSSISPPLFRLREYLRPFHTCFQVCPIRASSASCASFAVLYQQSIWTSGSKKSQRCLKVFGDPRYGLPQSFLRP